MKKKTRAKSKVGTPTEYTVSPSLLQEQGYLQEANRMFFHPHGLEIGVVKDRLVVLDLRHRKVGAYYEEMTPEQVILGFRLAEIYARRQYFRTDALGFVVQPLSTSPVKLPVEER